MFEKFLLLALVFALGAGALAHLFCQHLKRTTDAFMDHLLLQEQVIEEKVAAEVAKRFNG
jgi:hypothetical protein